MDYFFVVSLTEVGRHTLMIEFGKHAIQKTCFRVIRIAWQIRFGMVNMVRYNIDLLRHRPNDKILRDYSPNWVTEFVRLVGAIPMKPNGAMRSHDRHAV